MAANRERASEKGATAILMAVMLVGLIGFAAFAVDLGFGLVVKSELQNVADTGALAANRELAQIYQGLSGANAYYGEYSLSASDKQRIEAKVNQFSQQNKAGGVAISVISSDMLYGKYNKDTGQIEPASKGVTAIRVGARRDESANGVVATFLGRVLGINSFSIDATSGAQLSALKKAPAGALGIPVGISEFWFKAKNSPCGRRDTVNHGIRLYPTGPQAGETMTNAQGCAGWHTFNEYPASASRLGSILDGLRTGAYVSPTTEAGVTHYNFTGGVVSSQWNNMKQLFNANKDGDQTWTTVVPVYQSADCSNPNGSIKIVGFATAYIYNVIERGGEKIIDATVECNIIDWGEGGGDDYGTLVGRPGMVE